MRLYRFDPPSAAELQTRRDLLRSTYAVAVAESLYQFTKLSSHAQLADLPAAERRRYHELAQHVIALLENPE